MEDLQHEIESRFMEFAVDETILVFESYITALHTGLDQLESRILNTTTPTEEDAFEPQTLAPLVVEPHRFFNDYLRLRRSLFLSCDGDVSNLLNDMGGMFQEKNPSLFQKLLKVFSKRSYLISFFTQEFRRLKYRAQRFEDQFLVRFEELLAGEVAIVNIHNAYKRIVGHLPALTKFIEGSGMSTEEIATLVTHLKQLPGFQQSGNDSSTEPFEATADHIDSLMSVIEFQRKIQELHVQLNTAHDDLLNEVNQHVSKRSTAIAIDANTIKEIKEDITQESEQTEELLQAWGTVERRCKSLGYVTQVDVWAAKQDAFNVLKSLSVSSDSEVSNAFDELQECISNKVSIPQELVDRLNKKFEQYDLFVLEPVTDCLYTAFVRSDLLTEGMGINSQLRSAHDMAVYYGSEDDLDADVIEELKSKVNENRSNILKILVEVA